MQNIIILHNHNSKIKYYNMCDVTYYYKYYIIISITNVYRYVLLNYVVVSFLSVQSYIQSFTDLWSYLPANNCIQRGHNSTKIRRNTIEIVHTVINVLTFLVPMWSPEFRSHIPTDDEDMDTSLEGHTIDSQLSLDLTFETLDDQAREYVNSILITMESEVEIYSNYTRSASKSCNSCTASHSTYRCFI